MPDSKAKFKNISRWVEDWTRWVNSSEQATETVTTDPDSVLKAVRAGAKGLGFPVVVWDCARGLDYDENDLKITRQVETLSKAEDFKYDPKFLEPLSILRLVKAFDLPDTNPAGEVQKNGVFVLMNFYPFFEIEAVRQEFENLCQAGELASDTYARPVHFLSAPYEHLGLKGVHAVRHFIVPVPFPLPTEDEIREEYVDEMANRLVAAEPSQAGNPNRTDDRYMNGIAAACRGLERPHAARVLWNAASMVGEFDERLPVQVARMTAAMLAEAGTMEVIQDEQVVPPEQLGGVRAVMQALHRAANTFTPEAAAQALDRAKGLYLCGTTGSGKSEVAKTAGVVFSRVTGQPWRVIRVRGGAFYGGLVGDTERNWYDFERRIKAFGRCIVFWDELDKMFGGVGGHDGDGGTRQSLYGLWLGWMSDPSKRGDAYVIAAMNDPGRVPPETLRAGRFDCGFFFDLPGHAARVDVLKIHLGKRLKKLGLGLDSLGVTDTQWNELGEDTDGYLPADLEVLVEESRTVAFEKTGRSVPDFATIKGEVARRKAEVEAHEESRVAEKLRMARVAELRSACFAARAKPVDYPATPPVVITAPGQTKVIKRPIRINKQQEGT